VRKSEKTWQVVPPDEMKNPPQPHEIEAAEIVAEHFNYVIQFLEPLDDYKRKTPDVVMNGKIVEIKSPEGKSRKVTVRRQFDRATKQLANEMIFDGRRAKLTDEFLRSEISKELKKRHRITRVIFIGKDGNAIEITK